MNDYFHSDLKTKLDTFLNWTFTYYQYPVDLDTLKGATGERHQKLLGEINLLVCS